MPDITSKTTTSLNSIDCNFLLDAQEDLENFGRLLKPKQKFILSCNLILVAAILPILRKDSVCLSAVPHREQGGSWLLHGPECGAGLVLK